MTCTLCAEEATWLIEWGVRDVAREPRRGGQPVCSPHVGPALDRRDYDSFRLTRLKAVPQRHPQQDVFLHPEWLPPGRER